jgi:hypothetical protein
MEVSGQLISPGRILVSITDQKTAIFIHWAKSSSTFDWTKQNMFADRCFFTIRFPLAMYSEYCRFVHTNTCTCVGLRPLACWDCGFESHRGHGCLSVVSVVCCQVQVSASLCDGLITCPEESYRLWCVVVCDLETSWMRRPWPNGALAPKKCTYILGVRQFRLAICPTRSDMPGGLSIQTYNGIISKREPFAFLILSYRWTSGFSTITTVSKVCILNHHVPIKTAIYFENRRKITDFYYLAL